MNRVKRVSALALAAMMILTVTAATLSQMGYAANPSSITISGVTASSKTFKDGDTINRIDFKVEDLTNGIGQNAVTKNAKIKIDDDSHFKSDQIQIANITESNTKPNNADFSVVVFDAKVSGKGTTLKFTVEDKPDGTDPKIYKQTFEVAIPGFDDGSGGSDSSSTPDPVPTDSKTKYSVTKVSTSVNSNGVPIPYEHPKYDIDNLDNRSDSTIRQTYFVDITLFVTASNVPAGISDVTLTQKTDLGSFLFDPASGSTMKITATRQGYDIKLTALRYSGNSKTLLLRIDTEEYMTDLSVDISECMTRKEAANESDTNNSSNDDDDRPMESETPYVIVSKHSYGGGTVTAGETFNFSLTFLNTSENREVGNMMITLTMPDDLMLTSASNTFYVPTLASGGSITKSVQVTAKPAAKVQSHNITVAMKYQYVDERVGTRKDATTSETVAIPVVQIDRFEVTNVDIPMEAMLEEEVSITVNYVNKGRSEVYNLAASIEGNMQNPGQNQNLGNLASGLAGTADFFVKPSALGTLSGMITITYEDTNMEQKVATIPYSTTIVEMGDSMNGGMMIGGGGMAIPGMGEGEVPPEDAKSKLPIYIAIGVVVVLIPIGVIIKKRINKKRREREDADL